MTYTGTWKPHPICLPLLKCLTSFIAGVLYKSQINTRVISWSVGPWVRTGKERVESEWEDPVPNNRTWGTLKRPSLPQYHPWPFFFYCSCLQWTSPALAFSPFWLLRTLINTYLNNSACLYSCYSYTGANWLKPSWNSIRKVFIVTAS